MYELPTSVDIGGVEYSIRNDGDYRTILDIFTILEDTEIEKSERIMTALIVFYEDVNTVEDISHIPDMEEAVIKMYDFFSAGRKEGKSTNYKLIDWKEDSAIIVSAMNDVVGREIRTENYMHWWTFISYYMAIGESTLSTVVSIRDKMMRGEPLEKWEKKYRSNNPQYFKWNSQTVEQKEAEDWVLQQWNRGA
jgi:hypothetical protein